MSFDTRIISVRVAAAALVAMLVVVLDLAPSDVLVLAIVGAVVVIDVLLELVVQQRSAPPLVQPSFSAVSAIPGEPGPVDGWRQAPAPGASAPSVALPLEAEPAPLVQAVEPHDAAPDLPAPSPRPVRAVAPFEAARYVARARGEREVQCPRCGRFDIETRRVGAASAHQCRVCQQSWSWTAGTPWPTTRPIADLRVLGLVSADDASDAERGEQRHGH